MSTLPVDPTNADQWKAWNGTDGIFWTRHADRLDDLLSRYQPGLLDAAAIQPTDRVLDVGCGTGRTTRDAARLARAGMVLGVDLSESMLELARRRAQQERVDNVRFEQADAQVYVFDSAGFDVLISRMGIMFFADPFAAFANLARALRPGGRVALLTWQPASHNAWLQACAEALTGRPFAGPPADAPGPFSLSDPDRVRALLRSSGFTGVELADQQQRVRVGTDVEEAMEFATGQFGWLLEGADETTRSQGLSRLHASVAAHLTAEGVLYDSAAWLVTARH